MHMSRAVLGMRILGAASGGHLECLKHMSRAVLRMSIPAVEQLLVAI